MRLYYMLGAVAVFAVIMIISAFIQDKPSADYVERIGREAQEEINLHYANTVMTGLQDDRALQKAIDRYKEVLPSNTQPYDLIAEVERTYPAVSGKRCMLNTTDSACRRYLETVEPFIYK